MRRRVHRACRPRCSTRRAWTRCRSCAATRSVRRHRRERERGSAMKVQVVVPTYDERENLERFVTKVLAQDPDLHVLVIDDASPDGTGALADALAAREPRLRVLHRPAKLGLGSAYVEGFRYALRQTDARFVIQMDADLSHDPADVPALLAAAEEADIAVGSRYAGGIRVIDWPLRRLLLSV